MLALVSIETFPLRVCGDYWAFRSPINCRLLTFVVSPLHPRESRVLFAHIRLFLLSSRPCRCGILLPSALRAPCWRRGSLSSGYRVRKALHLSSLLPNCRVSFQACMVCDTLSQLFSSFQDWVSRRNAPARLRRKLTGRYHLLSVQCVNVHAGQIW